MLRLAAESAKVLGDVANGVVKPSRLRDLTLRVIASGLAGKHRGAERGARWPVKPEGNERKTLFPPPTSLTSPESLRFFPAAPTSN